MDCLVCGIIKANALTATLADFVSRLAPVAALAVLVLATAHFATTLLPWALLASAHLAVTLLAWALLASAHLALAAARGLAPANLAAALGPRALAMAQVFALATAILALVPAILVRTMALATALGPWAATVLALATGLYGCMYTCVCVYKPRI